jgi:hypothetical protein
MLARLLYQGADLAPALPGQRYVTSPDSAGHVKALSSLEWSLSFAPSYQLACWPCSV